MASAAFIRSSKSCAISRSTRSICPLASFRSIFLFLPFPANDHKKSAIGSSLKNASCGLSYSIFTLRLTRGTVKSHQISPTEHRQKDRFDGNNKIDSTQPSSSLSALSFLTSTEPFYDFSGNLSSAFSKKADIVDFTRNNSAFFFCFSSKRAGYPLLCETFNCLPSHTRVTSPFLVR